MLRALRPSRGHEGLMAAANQPAKLAMLAMLPLLLLSYGVSSARCSTIPDNTTDMLSLLEFKRDIAHPGVLNSWNSSMPHCQWDGVNCSRKHPGRVTVLTLPGLGLAGPISPYIGNLTFLEILDLSSNRFSGELPPLHRFHKLKNLTLCRNSLHGIIPDTLTNCSNLNYLELSGNSLTGQIPLNIGLLSNLSYLGLSANNLTGTIPPSLKNNSQLSILALSDNQLTGSIPDELGQLIHLQLLFLGSNNLLGGIRGTLFNSSSLQYIDLDSNMLGNTLPSEIGNTLPKLSFLYLSSNKFEGNIPASLGNISGLIELDLSNNSFIGQVPSSLGKYGTLNYLNLRTNKLEANDSQGWEFIDTLSNSSSLQTLLLNQNQFHGAIPNSVTKLSNLQMLGLGINNFSGTVPTSIGNLTGLIQLELRYNNLDGSIEGWVGNLTNLERLILNTNSFNGPIPSSIGNLNKLSVLLLEENKFEGSIPPSLGNLPMLTRLNLSYNNLQGNIPKDIFYAKSALIQCVLSYNSLEGHVPPEIGSLKQLIELHLSSNKFVGEIPATLGNCVGLQVLEMDHNFLRGNITMALGGLQSMTILNLSHNNLSGFIPTKLGDLQHLTQLDLSYNNLQGAVPTNGVFGNAKSVSLLGNLGLCGGVRDLHMCPCPTVSRSKELQYYLIRVLIPAFGIMSLIMSIYAIIPQKKKSTTRYSLLFSFGKKFPRVCYKDLAQATANFSEFNLIGRGSYGSVYRGKLSQAKIQVAIKVFDLEMRFADKSFVSECEVLRSIRHRNLVPILTACSTIDNRGNDFKALIYEFMHNGNLDTWLHHKHGVTAPKLLGLARKISIAVDLADALAYLHHECGRPIVHCDLKPTNILLDDDMNAYLGDFGIARLVIDSRSTTVGQFGHNSSVAVTGTIGYIAPEYGQSVHASTSGDVYSFGIVLLEMLISKKPTDSMFEGELSIVNFVERNFPDQISSIIDSHLQEECKCFIQQMEETQNVAHRCLLSLVQVALSCTRLLPRERKNMREVAVNLHAIRKSYVGATIKREQVMHH